jgi:hypothetical protein
VVEGSGELSDARPFPEVGVPDTLDLDHLDQPFLQDGCGVEHRHRTGWLGGQGGPALADHSAPGWVRFTLSLAKGRTQAFTAIEVEGNERDRVIAAYLARMGPIKRDFDRRPGAADHPTFRVEPI